MDLLEYQGKQYFARWGIPVPPGRLATSADEAVLGADELGYPVAVKAQVLVGGRGKAGGIRLAASAEEARSHAGAILGMDISGHRVERLWVERATDVVSEYYASFTLDRSRRLHLGLLSCEGGIDIEVVAERSPDALARLSVDPVDGLTPIAAGAWVAAAGVDAEAATGAAEVLARLYRCYTEGDCDLAEINPLVLTAEGQVLALDAKVTLDDSAAFRHPEWDEFRGTARLDPREALARAKGLQYVGLDGSVGIIANGAGLAMATCDVVHQAGGSPANFLDIGGGASAEVMAGALELVNSDDSVGSILVNIFGGITKGEDVANGIVAALGRAEMRAPMVVRLDGTNAAEGRAILAGHESDRLVPRQKMLDAARCAVDLAGAARARSGPGPGA